ncbi:MAG: ABC transporter ATP-binding protein [Spirochaetia bacterium]
MNTIIEVKDLRKQFPGVLAVDDVSFSIPQGICFGLLGPNGAGKTTTIEMMEGILEPTAGSVLFKGRPIDQQFKERVGIQFQHTALQEFITVRETLELFSALYPKHRTIEEIIQICSLQDIQNRDNRKLSGGQRQRMLLGLALINDPELVFLDEPTTGLDPQARRNFWDLIEKIKAEDKTILLTTHYMDEAEKLCDDIAIMDHGKIIARNSPKELLKEHFDGDIIRVPCSYVGDKEIPKEARVRNGNLEIQTRNITPAIRSLQDHGISLDGLSIHSPHLDDLFLKLTGTSLRA